MAKSGTGGTATTFKSELGQKSVTTGAADLHHQAAEGDPEGSDGVGQVRATTTVDGVTTGVNGVCVYLKGNNNNGRPHRARGRPTTAGA